MAQVSQSAIGNYWVRYWRRTRWFVISMQVILVAVVVGSLLVSGVVSLASVVFWIVVLAMLVTAIALNLVVIWVASEPLKQLVATLAVADGERPIIKPPSPNAKQYERSGFKPLLQLIYKFGSGETAVSAETSAETATKSTTMLEDALDNTLAGVIVFSKDGKISYRNKQAPVTSSPEGELLDLFFATDVSFENWLKDCEKNAVHAEKHWTHIATNGEMTDERKIYDVAASYNKGSDALVVMVCFEKTDQYMPEDKDLDFIAFAAHELRGPITVIRGYLDVLGDESHDAPG